MHDSARKLRNKNLVKFYKIIFWSLKASFLSLDEFYQGMWQKKLYVSIIYFISWRIWLCEDFSEDAGLALSVSSKSALLSTCTSLTKTLVSRFSILESKPLWSLTSSQDASKSETYTNPVFVWVFDRNSKIPNYKSMYMIRKLNATACKVWPYWVLGPKQD